MLSDIHANGRALAAALDVACNKPLDCMIVLGDLLTYGCDIDQVLDLMAEAQSKQNAVLILGNHDQLYFDLQDGVRDCDAGLPDWVRESIDYTMAAVPMKRLSDGLVWEKQFVVGDMLFAHANPYVYGDWRYLNSESDHVTATRTLEDGEYVMGTFGHTHRRRIFARRSDGSMSCNGSSRRLSREELSASRVVLNPGSMGQPRDG